jgi:glycine betaine/proline transport system substrate-binding protein
MLAELSAALDAGENIAVTLWRPHWAYDEFPIRDLADPEGTLGDSESIHSIARTGFEDDFPQLTEWIQNFEMSSELLYELENVMFNVDEVPSDFTAVVEQWIADNQEYVDGLTS